MHYCLVPLTAWLGTIFKSVRKTSKISGRVRAVDMRNILLVLPFLLHNLLQEEVEEYKRNNPFDPIVDPSDECIGIVLLFINFYHLFRRRYPPKDEVDIQDLQVLSLRYFLIILILLINTLNTYFTYFTYVKLTCLYFRFLDQCRTVFPFKNSQACFYMATEKVHSIIHSPNDVAHFGHYLNYCCEAPEKGHKVWVGQQGEKTNQGPEVQLTMMIHSLRKEGSAVLCEAVQGEFLLSIILI